MTDKIIVEKEGPIAWLTFNHPERRNAMTLEMWQAVGDAFEDFAADENVRVAVMKGAGGKAFVSGADISQFEKTRANAEMAAKFAGIADGARAKISQFEKPLIAMIQGFCMGGGLGVALQADLRIASWDSQFGIPAARLGIVYNFPSLNALTTLVGPGVAKKILFTGRRYSAEEALRMRLVEEVVPTERLESVVRGYAETIAENAPLSLRGTKLTIAEILKDESERDRELLKQLGRDAFDSEDYKEGRTAFMEKRTPAFKGR